MFLKIMFIGCAVLPIVLNVARSQRPYRPGLERVSPSKQFGQEGPVKPMPTTKAMPPTDYQDFVLDGYRRTSDIDSIESNSNINVNVNSNIPSKLLWNQPQTYRTNRPPKSRYGRHRRRRLDQFIPRIRVPPNSNIDYNFAHPDGNLRLERKRISRRKFLINNRKLAEEDFQPSVPKEDSVCYPIIFRAVEHLKLMESNMINLEKELRTFLLGSRANNSNYNVEL